MVNRRHFLKQSWLIAGASFFMSPLPSGLTRRIPGAMFDRVDRVVLGVIGKYSSDILMHGGAVAAKLAGIAPGNTHFIARVDDFNALSNTLVSLSQENGVGHVYTHGNIVLFTRENRRFSVENLDPALFSTRIAELNAGANLVFAHESLFVQAADGIPHDPLSTGSELRLMKKESAPSAALNDVINGWIAIHDYGLTPSADFLAFENDLLDSQVSEPALPIVREFLRKLDPMAQSLPPEKIAALLNSPFLSSAFARSLQVDTAATVNQFFRNRTDSLDADSALWLALLLAPQISDGTVCAWINPGCPRDRHALLTTLSKARSIV